MRDKPVNGTRFIILAKFFSSCITCFLCAIVLQMPSILMLLQSGFKKFAAADCGGDISSEDVDQLESQLFVELVREWDEHPVVELERG